MSGGHWNYIQARMSDVADDIRREARKNSVPRPSDWYDGQTVEPFRSGTLAALEQAAAAIDLAARMVKDVDWLLEGDDSEASFLANAAEWPPAGGLMVPENGHGNES